MTCRNDRWEIEVKQWRCNSYRERRLTKPPRGLGGVSWTCSHIFEISTTQLNKAKLQDKDMDVSDLSDCHDYAKVMHYCNMLTESDMV